MSSFEVAFPFSLVLGPEFHAWLGWGFVLEHGRGLGRLTPVEEACGPSSPVWGESCYYHHLQFILSLPIYPLKVKEKKIRYSAKIQKLNISKQQNPNETTINNQKKVFSRIKNTNFGHTYGKK